MNLYARRGRLLDITRYFDGGVFGAVDDYRNFSKAILIQRILANSEFRGEISLVSETAMWRSRM